MAASLLLSTIWIWRLERSEALRFVELVIRPLRSSSRSRDRPPFASASAIISNPSKEGDGVFKAQNVDQSAWFWRGIFSRKCQANHQVLEAKNARLQP